MRKLHRCRLLNPNPVPCVPSTSVQLPSVSPTPTRTSTNRVHGGGQGWQARMPRKQAHLRLSVAQRMVMGSVALELSVPNAVAMAWEKPL